jgi:hypothetical protein
MTRKPVLVNLYRLGSHSLLGYKVFTNQHLALGSIVKVKDQPFKVKGFGFEPTGLAVHLGAL